MHIRCRKGLIAYHKFNQWHNNHEKFEHFILLNVFLEDATTMAPRSSLDREPTKKKAHVSPIVIFCFFFSASKFKRDVTQMGFTIVCG